MSFKNVLEDHVEELPRLLQEFRQKSGSDATPVAGKPVFDEEAGSSAVAGKPVFKTFGAEPASAALGFGMDLARQALQDAESRLPPDAQADEDLAKASKHWQRPGICWRLLHPRCQA